MLVFYKQKGVILFNKIFIFIVVLTCTFSLKAYEPPKINLVADNKPKIILFTAENILVGEELCYKMQWKTINATHVQVTYLGNIALSGTLIITEDEYKKGAITLTATSTKSSYADSKTINKSLEEERNASPIIHPSKENNMRAAPRIYNPSYYNNRRARRIRKNK